MAVDVVHFNPRRRPPGMLSRLRPRRPLNNFGDLIGPALVSRIVTDAALAQPHEPRRLVAVGSIMRLTRPGDVVWGAGVNGKSMDTGAAPNLDVRAVRGPRTRSILMAQGTDVPRIYGDPALLWSRYWPRAFYEEDLTAVTRREVAVVPNHNERRQFLGERMIDPLGQPHDVIRQIVASDFVCGSSLHGIVLAESFGIPARLIRSTIEPSFKYDDYYAGTGRATYEVARSVSEAIEMGGEEPPIFDADGLLAAFPYDLYESPESQGIQSSA